MIYFSIAYAILGILTLIIDAKIDYEKGIDLRLGDAFIKIIFMPLIWPIALMILISDNSNYVLMKGKKK